MVVLENEAAGDRAVSSATAETYAAHLRDMPRTGTKDRPPMTVSPGQRVGTLPVAVPKMETCTWRRRHQHRARTCRYAQPATQRIIKIANYFWVRGGRRALQSGVRPPVQRDKGRPAGIRVDR
jgi:hypothetical protein